jgi:hypothetical protein
MRFPEPKLCQAHHTRRGSRVLADRVVDGEGMCEDCFRSEPLEDFSPGRAGNPRQIGAVHFRRAIGASA